MVHHRHGRTVIAAPQCVWYFRAGSSGEQSSSREHLSFKSGRAQQSACSFLWNVQLFILLPMWQLDLCYGLLVVGEEWNSLENVGCFLDVLPIYVKIQLDSVQRQFFKYQGREYKYLQDLYFSEINFFESLIGMWSCPWMTSPRVLLWNVVLWLTLDLYKDALVPVSGLKIQVAVKTELSQRCCWCCAAYIISELHELWYDHTFW